MLKFIQQLFTERDNATGDLVRVMFWIGFVWLLAVATWSVATGKTVFDMPTSAGALTAYLVGYGGSLALKRKAETGTAP